MTNYYERISYIANKCLENKIPFEIKPCWEGWQIKFAWADNADIAAHSWTYGTKSGLVESYQFPWDDDDVSTMTPEEAFEKIKKLWFETV